MNYSKTELWQRFQQYYTEFPQLGLALDLSRMNFPEDFFSAMASPLQRAFAAMAELEKGAIANPDEKRMVGHYWLRNPALAPSPAIRKEIEDTVADIKAFAAQVHNGTVHGARGPFKNLLLIGIGGSALGPQFVANALGHPGRDKLAIYFFDNTDPDGMDQVLAKIGPELGQTLCLVISKSGGTKETRNGMLEAKAAYEEAGLDFGATPVAITSARVASWINTPVKNGWLKRFPMWDWVGGRTSELSAVGLLPAALQGFDIDSLLAGAKACDEVTRIPDPKANPSAQLALMWYYSGNGKGSKNMVVLPYKDRLELFSKYLQQLIMESLGKQLDLDGNSGQPGHHGLWQQRLHRPAFLYPTASRWVEQFLRHLHRGAQGPRRLLALWSSQTSLLAIIWTASSKERAGLFLRMAGNPLPLSLTKSPPFAVGTLIALFERTVGLYASSY